MKIVLRLTFTCYSKCEDMQSIAETRELKGEIHDFHSHDASEHQSKIRVIERFERLEKKMGRGIEMVLLSRLCLFRQVCWH
jgi:hypothetical protein